jgi:hypothetical protein
MPFRSTIDANVSGTEADAFHPETNLTQEVGQGVLDSSTREEAEVDVDQLVDPVARGAKNRYLPDPHRGERGPTAWPGLSKSGWLWVWLGRRPWESDGSRGSDSLRWRRGR